MINIKNVKRRTYFYTPVDLMRSVKHTYQVIAHWRKGVCATNVECGVVHSVQRSYVVAAFHLQQNPSEGRPRSAFVSSALKSQTCQTCTVATHAAQSWAADGQKVKDVNVNAFSLRLYLDGQLKAISTGLQRELYTWTWKGKKKKKKTKPSYKWLTESARGSRRFSGSSRPLGCILAPELDIRQALLRKVQHKPLRVFPCMCTPSASPRWLANTPASTDGGDPVKTCGSCLAALQQFSI